MNRILTSCILLFAVSAAAGDVVWRPVSTFAVPRTEVRGGRLHRVRSIEVAPDAGIAVFLQETSVSAAQLEKTEIVSVDLSSGRDISREKVRLVGADMFAGLSPEGSLGLVVPSSFGGLAQFPVLWSRGGGLTALDKYPRWSGPLGAGSDEAIGAHLGNADSGWFAPTGRLIAIPARQGYFERGTTWVGNPAIAILNLDGPADDVVALPKAEWGHSGPSQCAWSADGRTLLAAFAPDRSEQEPEAPPASTREGDLNRSSTRLYRLDVATHSWRAIGTLPPTFAGFTASDEVVIWDSVSFPKRGIAVVAVSALESVHPDPDWWTQFASSASFERIIGDTSNPYLTAVRVFIGQQRSYALVVRGSKESPNEPIEIWERVRRN